jgi:hypothetical protein
MRFLCFMFFLNKRLDGGAVGVVVIQFNKRFRPVYVAENGNKQRHLRSPLEASSQLQKNVIVVGWVAQARCVTNQQILAKDFSKFLPQLLPPVLHAKSKFINSTYVGV